MEFSETLTILYRTMRAVHHKSLLAIGFCAVLFLMAFRRIQNLSVTQTLVDPITDRPSVEPEPWDCKFGHVASRLWSRRPTNYEYDVKLNEFQTFLHGHPKVRSVTLRVLREPILQVWLNRNLVEIQYGFKLCHY